MPTRRETIGAALLAGAIPVLPAQAEAPVPPPPLRQHAIRSADGVEIAAYEIGNPDGVPILFIHGYAQSAISWSRQMYDRALAEEFRLVAIDLRGHCMSSKPEGREHYHDGRRWADDVKAVMDSLSLRRPVLVGWS